MLTARNVIFAIIAVAILSVVSAAVSILTSGQSYSALARDSYGTRAQGYRAVYDLLGILGFETERALLPVASVDTLAASYVLWNPRDAIVQTEPAYFKSLSQWVRDGGRLIVAPGEPSEDIQDPDSTLEPVALLEELGLAQVAVEEIPQDDQHPDEIGDAEDDRGDADSRDIRESVRDMFVTKKRPSIIFSIECEGEWSYLNAIASQVQLPVDEAWGLTYGELKPLARITLDNSVDGPGTLAAMFTLGEGKIVVVSNPFLASNANLDRKDNSVLLTHLLAGRRSKVIFDEFYHGLTVRGNVFWLLTKRSYAVITVSLLAVVGLWIWRWAIFLGPCREDRPASRRSLNEYIEAMARFMIQGRKSPEYVLREVRDGVLWHFGKTLGLPPQQKNSAMILGLLTRRQPQKARQLQAALENADAVLENPRAPKNEILFAIRKVSDCLLT